MPDTPRRAGALRVGATLIAATALTGGYTSDAVARSPVTPGFALAAQGFPSYFQITARRGTVRSLTLLVANRTDRRQVVVLRAVDTSTASTGGVAYGSTPARGTGRWITLRGSRVALGPGSVARVVFTVRVPDHVRSGDHLAGVTAINLRDLAALARRRRPHHGVALRFLPRLAMAVQVHVPGPRHVLLRPRSAAFEVLPAGTFVRLGLVNAGNQLISRTTGRLRLRQGNRVLVDRPVTLGAFVPRTAIHYALKLPGTPATGTYRLTGVVGPRHGAAVRVDTELRFGDANARRLKRDTGRDALRPEASPVMAIMLGFAVLVAAAFAFAWWRANRRTRPPGARGDRP